MFSMRQLGASALEPRSCAQGEVNAIHLPGLFRRFHRVAAIDALAGEVSLQDPDRLIALLASSTTATAIQLRRLWEIAVAQSTIADVQRASGEGAPRLDEWQRGWSAAADLLRNTMVESTGGEAIAEALSTYWEESRAVGAFPPFALRVRRLEGLLRRQRGVIGFHWADEENAYRTRERQLSQRLSAPDTRDEDRLSAATQLLEEIRRYEAVYVPKLDAVAVEVSKAFSDSEHFLSLFSHRRHPEVHRWHNLTRDLIAARSAAVKYVRHALQFDALIPNAVIERNMSVEVVDGKTTPMLTGEAPARFRQFADQSVLLAAQSAQKEQELEAEWLSLVRAVIGEQDLPTPKGPEPKRDRAAGAQKRSHPIERKAWYRLATICWWGVLVMWSAFSLLVSATWSLFLIVGLVGVGVLYAVRAALFYVVLGRATLYERPGSPFVDLDMFEQQLFEETDGNATDELQELRKRYGARVPVEVMQTFIRMRLSSVQKDRQRILADADRGGKTISVESLRASMLKGQPSGAERDDYLLFFELLLLRLEVRHGPEIPVSVVAEETDAISASASEAGADR